MLVKTSNNQSTVARTGIEGFHHGIKAGMSLAMAQSLVSNIQVGAFNPLSDFQHLYKLAAWCFKVSPLVGLDAEIITAYKKRKLSAISTLHDGINLDLRGTERIYTDLEAHIIALHSSFQRNGLTTKIAAAPTLGAAWALARFEKHAVCFCNDDTLAEQLAELPVASLRISEEVCQALHAVGVKTVRSLVAIPRKKLLERYGKDCLRRLDEALGELPERVSITPVINRWIVTREYEYPLRNHESIVTTVLTLLDELITKLLEHKKKAKRFIVWFEGEDANKTLFRVCKEFSLLTASTNALHVRSVIYPIVEGLKIPGPIFCISIVARDIERDVPLQKDLQGTEQTKLEATELLNHFVTRLGRKNVLRMQFKPQYLPELSFETLPIETPTSALAIESSIRARPSYLLPKAEEIAALARLPDKPPVRIIWKGKLLQVLQGIGPERITVPWWQDTTPDLTERDYFKIQDATGRWLWVYRNTQTQKWYVHGMWI